MKIAILFDWIEGVAGGEKLLKFLAQRYNADIFTGYVNWNKTYPEFKSMKVNVLSGISKIPFLKQEQLIRKFRELNLQNYDVIISFGFYTIYSSIKNHPVIWYPYGVSPFFYKKGEGTIKMSLFQKIGWPVWKARIKKYDKLVVKNYIDKIVTISNYSKEIVKQRYEREASVIPPPVETKRYHYKPPKDFYLVVSRLEPGKRVELAIEAFKKMPDQKLVIEGTGTLFQYHKNLAKGYKNIKFLGRIKSENLPKLYSNCIALIGTAFHDDWSMPMIEAMASGKPVIGVNQGAYPEIITENKTGTLVNGDPEGIIKGVIKITPKVAKKMKKSCLQKAKELDIKNFYKKWDKIVSNI